MKDDGRVWCWFRAHVWSTACVAIHLLNGARALWLSLGWYEKWFSIPTLSHLKIKWSSVSYVTDVVSCFYNCFLVYSLLLKLQGVHFYDNIWLTNSLFSPIEAEESVFDICRDTQCYCKALLNSAVVIFYYCLHPTLLVARSNQAYYVRNFVHSLLLCHIKHEQCIWSPLLGWASLNSVSLTPILYVVNLIAYGIALIE